jgi:hypothetical protein
MPLRRKWLCCLWFLCLPSLPSKMPMKTLDDTDQIKRSTLSRVECILSK